MGRQVGLVFFGKPRSEAAAHAQEPGNRMTLPLLVLAFFAAVLGLINVPFIKNGWLHHFAGLVHESSGTLHLEAVPFQFSVAIVSTIMAVGGFLIGWAMYRNLKAGQRDPLEKMLGPVFTVLKNKYYFDELYMAIFIKPTVKLATLCAKFDYDWVINPIVNTVGRIGVVTAIISAKFDEIVIDGLGVLGTARFFKWTGKELRLTQSGQVSNYLLTIALSSLALVGMYLFFIRM